MQVCQNGVLATSPKVEINIDELISRYMNNPITSAIVVAGLEPFDSFNDLTEFISKLRDCTNDDVVIYTGYYKEEIKSYVEVLKECQNIVVKFGRFIPNQKAHYDEILGVILVSDNQYAERIS